MCTFYFRNLSIEKLPETGMSKGPSTIFTSFLNLKDKYHLDISRSLSPLLWELPSSSLSQGSKATANHTIAKQTQTWPLRCPGVTLSLLVMWYKDKQTQDERGPMHGQVEKASWPSENTDWSKHPKRSLNKKPYGSMGQRLGGAARVWRFQYLGPLFWEIHIINIWAVKTVLSLIADPFLS